MHYAGKAHTFIHAALWPGDPPVALKTFRDALDRLTADIERGRTLAQLAQLETPGASVLIEAATSGQGSMPPHLERVLQELLDERATLRKALARAAAREDDPKNIAALAKTLADNARTVVVLERYRLDASVLRANALPPPEQPVSQTAQPSTIGPAIRIELPTASA